MVAKCRISALTVMPSTPTRLTLRNCIISDIYANVSDVRTMGTDRARRDVCAMACQDILCARAHEAACVLNGEAATWAGLVKQTQTRMVLAEGKRRSDDAGLDQTAPSAHPPWANSTYLPFFEIQVRRLMVSLKKRRGKQWFGF